MMHHPHQRNIRRQLLVRLILLAALLGAATFAVYAITAAPAASRPAAPITGAVPAPAGALPPATPLPLAPAPAASPTTGHPAIIPTPPLAFSNGTPPLASTGRLQVHFINVGQGDSILILASNGTAMLIDGGYGGSGTLDYLQALGVRRIALLVATHPHADHIGGLVDVLKALPVGQVVTNGYPYTTQIYEQFLDAIAAAKVPYHEVSSGDTLQLDDLAFAVLNPVKGKAYADINQSSIVLRLQYGATSFLFTGDAGSQAEHDLLVTGQPLAATVLKVGHHGSSTASSPEFLRVVRPQIAIYSAGQNNAYGHPHPSTLEHLAQVGARVYGTDVDGTVIVTADQQGYTVSTMTGAGPLTLPRPPPAIAGDPSVETPSTSPPPPVPTLSTPASPATTPIRPPLTTTTPAEVLDGSTAPDDLPLTVVTLTSPARRNGTARLEIQTIPGAACTITVLYKSGPSRAAGLDPQVADSNGRTSWSWKVGGNTTPGTWQIVVTAASGDQQVRKEIPFQVIR